MYVGRVVGKSPLTLTTIAPFQSFRNKITTLQFSSLAQYHYQTLTSEYHLTRFVSHEVQNMIYIINYYFF